MRTISEFTYHFLQYDEILPITVKGSYFKISKKSVSKYELFDNYTVEINSLVLPKGILEIDLDPFEIDSIEKQAVDSLIGR